MPVGGVDLDINTGDVRIRVEGLGKALRAMSKAGADAEDMRELMVSLGMIVVHAARPRTPVLSSRLSATLRPGRGRTKSVVRAGGARTPYAGVIHYGWPARNIAPQPFLSDAVTATRSKVLGALDKGIGDLLKKQNLT